MQRFMRFRTSLPGAHPATPLGVFRALGRLLEAEAMDSWMADRADEVLSWFNRHLPVPRLRDEHDNAVFWLRAECNDLVQRLWELAGVLRDIDVDVDLVRSQNPGRVCYEDRFQIAAIPWRGVRERRRTWINGR